MEHITVCITTALVSLPWKPRGNTVNPVAVRFLAAQLEREMIS
jgi:hypothetical protein